MLTTLMTSSESIPTTDLLDLNHATALITGGFSGLGLHFASVLAARGARIALMGRRIELGHQVATELTQKIGRPGDIRAYAVDVTDSDSVAEAFARARAAMGVATIVVNNAGTVIRKPSIDVSDAEWTGVVDVNLTGVFRVAQASARAMIEARTRGSIINIASILGLRVRNQVAAYAATKAAVVQLTKALALEWAKDGIRVNAIAPGYFETDLNREMLRSPMGQELIARIPQLRVGQLHELDGPLLLLASKASTYMTGTVIPVDGGHLVNTL
jgi:NAD(P)-dependent dehydrogenase (short-subunit alcohol dehydrogenase family)